MFTQALSAKKKPHIAADLPDIEILHKLRKHRLECHGSESNSLVLCKVCAQLEGQLKLLTDFLDAPTGEGVQ